MLIRSKRQKPYHQNHTTKCSFFIKANNFRKSPVQLQNRPKIGQKIDLISFATATSNGTQLIMKFSKMWSDIIWATNTWRHGCHAFTGVPPQQSGFSRTHVGTSIFVVSTACRCRVQGICRGGVCSVALFWDVLSRVSKYVWWFS